MKKSTTPPNVPDSTDAEHWSVPKIVWVALAGKPEEVNSLLERIKPKSWQAGEKERLKVNSTEQHTH
jgi:hypothetical protein